MWRRKLNWGLLPVLALLGSSCSPAPGERFPTPVPGFSRWANGTKSLVVRYAGRSHRATASARGRARPAARGTAGSSGSRSRGRTHGSRGRARERGVDAGGFESANGSRGSGRRPLPWRSALQRRGNETGSQLVANLRARLIAEQRDGLAGARAGDVAKRDCSWAVRKQDAAGLARRPSANRGVEANPSVGTRYS